jgi:hypothetical protein
MAILSRSAICHWLIIAIDAIPNHIVDVEHVMAGVTFSGRRATGVFFPPLKMEDGFRVLHATLGARGAEEKLQHWEPWTRIFSLRWQAHRPSLNSTAETV